MDVKVKTIYTKYVLKVDREIAQTLDTLREARLMVKSLPVNNIHTVEIVKQTLTECILDRYEPVTQTILVATQLDEDM